MKALILSGMLAGFVVATAWAESNGVVFEQAANWAAVVAKAKASRKMIFVDCYATWCQPCKEMERNVFPLPAVGDRMARDFLAVRVQMDQAAHDSPEVRKWYLDAAAFAAKYEVTALPTYLFFDADGNVLHKELGEKSVEEFLHLLDDAKDPGKQYYTLLHRVDARNATEAEVFGLMQRAEALSDLTARKQAARVLLDEFYNPKPPEEFLNRPALERLGSLTFAMKAGDRTFDFYLRHGERVDRVLENPGYSARLVAGIALRTDVTPALEAAKAKNAEPDWAGIARVLEAGFGARLAESLTVDARVQWYKAIRDWTHLIPWLIRKTDLGKSDDGQAYGLGRWFQLNETAWTIFQYSADRAELEKGLAYLERALTGPNPPEERLARGLLDTKANLLYKLDRLFRTGGTAQAIDLECQCVAIAEKYVSIEGPKGPAICREVVRKMEQGVPTWPEIAASGGVAHPGKPPLPLDVLLTWPRIEVPAISNDGAYVAYLVSSPVTRTKTLVVQATRSDWKKEITGIEGRENFIFSADCRQIAYRKGEQLFLQGLGNDTAQTKEHVTSFRAAVGGDGLLYQTSQPARSLVTLDLRSGEERVFASVEAFAAARDGKGVLLAMAETNDGRTTALSWLDIATGKLTSIWRSPAPAARSVASYAIDPAGQQIAFTVVEDGAPSSQASLWYFRLGTPAAVERVGRGTALPNGLAMSTEELRFSESGRFILFDLLPSRAPAAERKGRVKVHVWRYNDAVLMPEQRRKLGNFGGLRSTEDSEHYAAAVAVDGGKVTRLEEPDERIIAQGEFSGSGDFVVLKDGVANAGMEWWPWAAKPSFYLVNARDGSRRLLADRVGGSGLRNFAFSPYGGHLVYWDEAKAGYVSYNLKTATTKSLATRPLRPLTVDTEFNILDRPWPIAEIAAWQDDDAAILLSDRYDLWSIALEGDRAPINVTNGYGRSHGVQLRLAFGGSVTSHSEGSKLIYSRSTDLFLTAYDVGNKDTGFFLAKAGTSEDPRRLTMGPYLYFRTISQQPYMASEGFRPVKASQGTTWLVERQSATEAPNLFVTDDWKEFRPVSEFFPQKSYNWLTSELVSFTLPDGSLTQGIIYKPENFDPAKKYPVIMHYYRQMTQDLNTFLWPLYTGADLNIPWFVSNGYVVMVVDIHYSEVVEPAKRVLLNESARQAVEAGADFLAGLPYVDAKRIGLQGHSFGAAQTNYIVTHSSRFAAAAEFAGTTDPVSSFLTLVPFFSPQVESYDSTSRAASNLGATPWERPEIYVANSAVLNANKVTTPLLITHNEKDNQIPWRQGIEFYMALRRMGKKVWMLQYEDGTHGLVGSDAKDYTMRLTQFFDYYLKGAPPPKWMTEGVPAARELSDDGLELDRSGAVP